MPKKLTKIDEAMIAKGWIPVARASLRMGIHEATAYRLIEKCRHCGHKEVEHDSVSCAGPAEVEGVPVACECTMRTFQRVLEVQEAAGKKYVSAKSCVVYLGPVAAAALGLTA